MFYQQYQAAPRLNYIGCEEVPCGSEVRYFEYCGRRVAASLEPWMPCFEAYGFHRDARVLAVTVSGEPLPVQEAQRLLIMLGMNTAQPMYSYMQPKTQWQASSSTYLQELPYAVQRTRKAA